MRLTTNQSVMGRNRKHDIAYGMGAIWIKKIGKYKYELIEEVIDKLGQLEDIEDELGIDLIILFKAIKQGIWIKEEDNELVKIGVVLCKYGNEIGLSRKHIYDMVKFKDYGKTWALTKEELL